MASKRQIMKLLLLSTVLLYFAVWSKTNMDSNVNIDLQSKALNERNQSSIVVPKWEKFGIINLKNNSWKIIYQIENEDNLNWWINDSVAATCNSVAKNCEHTTKFEEVKASFSCVDSTKKCSYYLSYIFQRDPQDICLKKLKNNAIVDCILMIPTESSESEPSNQFFFWGFIVLAAIIVVFFIMLMLFCVKYLREWLYKNCGCFKKFILDRIKEKIDETYGTAKTGDSAEHSPGSSTEDISIAALIENAKLKSMKSRAVEKIKNLEENERTDPGTSSEMPKTEQARNSDRGEDGDDSLLPA